MSSLLLVGRVEILALHDACADALPAGRVEVPSTILHTLQRHLSEDSLSLLDSGQSPNPPLDILYMTPEGRGRDFSSFLVEEVQAS